MDMTVGIVGLGLIGGSLARRLAHGGMRVLAWNHTPRPYGQARGEGIECMESLEELAAAAPEVLVLCNPLVAMPEVLGRLSRSLSDEAVTLSDVGSVKAMVRDQVRRAGLADRYVGGHPMAGNERSGFAASDPGLYDGALWALTVDSATPLWRFAAVARLVTQGVGNRCIVVDDATHDHAAALISHMPHAVATALINLMTQAADRNVAAALSAGSWRDMTRVALTDPNRTRAMIDEDAANVEGLLRALSARLLGFADALHDGNRDDVDSFFGQGQVFRDFQAERAGGLVAPVRSVLDLPVEGWQRVLLDSARRGESVDGIEVDADSGAAAVRVLRQAVMP